jgi:hypothetical protein
MTHTVTVNPGYRYTGETVEISQKLTEEQFRRIEDILSRPPERFKDWADKFFFDPATPSLGDQLREYLREQRIAHSVERRETFALDELGPSASRA